MKHWVEHIAAQDVWLFVVCMVFLVTSYCWVYARSEAKDR